MEAVSPREGYPQIQQQISSIPHKLITFSEQIWPEEELRYLSMTDDIEVADSNLNSINHKWEIEPWKNKNQNPSQSPQRRPFIQKKPLPQKPQQNQKPQKPPKILQPTTNHNSLRVTRIPTPIILQHAHSENSGPSTHRDNGNKNYNIYKYEKQIFLKSARCDSSNIKNKPCFAHASETMAVTKNVLKIASKVSVKNGLNFGEWGEFAEGESSRLMQHPVNLIVYPMLADLPNRKKLKKMDKFRNFVSVSLRK